MLKVAYMAVVGFLAMSLAANADSVTLQLDPLTGTVSGLPSDTVGWGYALTNNTSDYLLVSTSHFCEPGQDPFFTTCSPVLGASSYIDFFSSNFILIAPNSSASASFDATSQSGVGEYSIDPSAFAGQSDSGSITVVYDLFDADPTTGSANQVCSNINVNGSSICDFEVSAAAAVDVAGATSAAPEPRLLLLLGICFGALIVREAGRKLKLVRR